MTICDPHYGGARYYVYKSTDPLTGKFYIGSRLGFGDPSTDTKYLGSGKWIKRCKKASVLIKKEILSEHPSLKIAVKTEYALILASKSDPLCMNRWNGNA